VQLSGDPHAKATAAVISERAVGTDQNRKFVYVVKADNTAEYRPVVLGPAVDGLRVVRQGLKPGEKIIVNGLQRVQPGAPVAAQLVAMDAGARPAGAVKLAAAAVGTEEK
jgi:multidrug efflux system membrane fusion protein